MPQGTLVAVEGAARDVSDRQRADAHLVRLNRMHRTLSAANERLVRAETEPALLETFCRAVVEHGGFRFAWVGYREEDPAGTVRPVAHAGHEAGYLASVRISWHDNEYGQGPAGAAIRAGRPVVSRDLAADPAMAPWSSEALARGYASVAALPLGRGGDVFGVLVIYSDERDAFGVEEIDLLENLAADLAYGVGTLQARAIREAGEAERIRLATAIEQTTESVVITDPDANIVYVNPAFERISGYTSAEVIGRNPRILQSGVQTAASYADMWATLTAGGTWTGQFENRRKDGTTYTEVASITPVVDASGSVASYVAVKRDVTRKRALEAQERRRGRERTLIADALEALRPLDTPEQTAESICRRIVALPEIAMASLLLLEPDGRALPLALIVDDDRVLERKDLGPERSLQLQARAAQGPWVEAWQPRVGHPYLADHLAIGLRGQAYAPVRSGATLIGLLTVGSRDPDAVALLTERLPAILEYASLAGALLAPSAARTTALAATRQRYQSIIDDRAFHPVFQPIVDLASRSVVGYEALTRFADGTRPDLGFAEARRCGLEGELESATLRAAIAAAEGLPGGCYLSLNVSPAFILAGDELRAILAARTRPIVLEITEHDSVADYAALRSAFVALGSGLRLAVDDAGAGVANFNHLVELRPQFVKVDMGLVHGVNADLARQALIVALLHFAAATDCHVIAEGIETEAERAVLEKLEIPFGQGYLFGRPAVASSWAAPAARALDAAPRGAARDLGRTPAPGVSAAAYPRSGIRASKRAPPSTRLAAPIRPPWRSTIQAAMARPRPVPPMGASSARQKRSKTCDRSSGRMPGPVSSTARTAASPSARTRTVTEPPGGVWATALSTRIVTSCRRRSGSPSTTAGSGSATRATPRSAASDVSGPAASTATSARSTGTCSSSIVPASVRARRRRSSTRAARWVVSASMSSRAVPTSATGWPALRRRSVTLVRITVSGVRSSWLALAANSRWRRRAASRRSIAPRIGTSARPA